MSDETKHNADEASQASAPTTRRRFMEMGLKGITLLPYVAPMMETYFINDSYADGDEGGSGGGSGSGSGGGKGKGKKKVSPPPGKGKGGGGGSGSGSGGSGGGDHSGSSGY